MLTESLVFILFFVIGIGALNVVLACFYLE